jgi:hypothetical protein
VYLAEEWWICRAELSRSQNMVGLRTKLAKLRLFFSGTVYWVEIPSIYARYFCVLYVTNGN